MKFLKKIGSFLFNRVFIVALMLVLQVALIVALILTFSRSSVYVYITLHVLSALVALWIISKEIPPEFKIIWIIFVLSFPVVGGLFYVFFGNRRVPKRMQRHLDKTGIVMEDYLPDTGLRPHNPYNQQHATYIRGISGYPVYSHSDTEYYEVGDTMYLRMMEEMEKAKRYICLEFFIVSDGIMLDEIMDLMERKIKEGVEIFFVYDDLGTIFNLSKAAKKRLQDIGVRTAAFNPFRPHLSTVLNHRDHRKIVLIDGTVAFTGGINIADEYINQKERFGHWKDTGVMLHGEAAWAFGVMFFQNWNFTTNQALDIHDYEPEQHYLSENDGYVQVFGDTPMDTHNLTETVYIKAVQQAIDYIYIATPYLVIDYALQEALCTAARGGVEVCINTPHIYDKWYVHTLTKSHYRHLVEAGVKIFEYTPGFLHGKMFVADDRVGIVGTANLDFRSFYHHFECSVVFYEDDILQKVKQDLVDTQAVSQRITLEEIKNTPFRLRLLQYLLKIFAPLM